MRILILLILVQTHLSFGQTVGVLEYKEGTAEGYSLISPMGFDTTYLIDNCGKVVQRWACNYKNGMFADITERGTLVKSAIDETTSHFVGGGASGILQEYSWEGKLLWEYHISDSTERQHHDLEVLPNGNILAVTWEKKSVDECVEAGRNPENLPPEGLWFTAVYEVKPIYPESAEVVWEWHAWDHLVQGFDEDKVNYGSVATSIRKMDINKGASNQNRKGKSDWAHVNGIHYNAELDHICLSAPKFNEIWIIDHSTTIEEATSSNGGKRGCGGDLLWRWGNPESYDMGDRSDKQLSFQHNCEWVKGGTQYDGQISVFSNRDKVRGENRSKVKIIDARFDHKRNTYPISNGKFLPESPSYVYTLVDTLFSPRVSGVQVLPNGNLLICSGANGHVIEIDNEENVLWQYLVPIAKKGNIARQGEILDKKKSLFTVQRYPSNYKGFEGKKMTSTTQIELRPLPCDKTAPKQ